MNKTDEIEDQISEKGIDLMYYTKRGRYRIRLSKSDVKQHEDFITQLLKQAHSEATN